MEFPWSSKVFVWNAIKAWQFPRLWLYNRLDENRICKEANGDRYAIIALGSQSNPLLDGMLHLLDVFNKKNVNSIVVINGNLPASIVSEIEKRAHRILFRKNYGRDFAAYREASLFLYNEGIKPSKVLYANDSVVYFDTPELENLVESLLAAEADFVGVTDSFEETYHIGSYLAVLSGNAFSHKKIEEFWRKYRIYNLRPHAIHAGEHLLSKTVIRCGFLTDTIYKIHNVAKKYDRMSISDILNTSYIAGARAIVVADVKKNDLKSQFHNVFGEIVRQRLITRLLSDVTANPIHVAFGFYRHFFKMPLVKKDLLARMQFSEEQVTRLIRDLTEKDKINTMALLNQRGRNTNKEFLFLLRLKLELA